MLNLIKQKRDLPNNVPHYMVTLFFNGMQGRQRKPKFQSITVGYIAKSEFNDITEREILAVSSRDAMVEKKVRTNRPVTINFDHVQSNEGGIFTWEPFHESNLKRTLTI